MLEFIIPFYPPSTNHAYFSRGGRLHLSTEGKKFKSAVRTHVTTQYPQLLRTIQKNVPYFLRLRFFAQDPVENKGWPRTCKTRYKKWDATNRVKLAEDALCDAFGIDDSQFLAVLTIKEGPLSTEAAHSPHFVASLWNLEQERDPCDAVQFHIPRHTVL